MNVLARCGDFSPNSYVQMKRTRHGFLITCQIGKERCWELPSPYFYGEAAGGRSLTTYHHLGHMYDCLLIDRHKRALISSGRGDGNCFFISRMPDRVSVFTENAYGGYGAEVLILKTSPHYKLFSKLFQSIRQDNSREPRLNALSLI